MIVYVAGAYRPATSAERDANIERAEAAALQLWLQGHVAVCPHAMTRSYRDPELDATFRAGMLTLLDVCDAVLLLDGWEESAGSRTEYERAAARGIAVYDDLTKVPKQAPASCCPGCGEDWLVKFDRVLERWVCRVCDWTWRREQAQGQLLRAQGAAHS